MLARFGSRAARELARYTTELKPKLSSFKNSNEPSRAEPSRATNEWVRASLRVSSFSSSPNCDAPGF
jgi:hypothetical protein